MRMRALYFSLPLSLLLFVIGCLSGFIDISASAFSDGRYMTASETLTVFGDTIPFRYFNGTDYIDSDFTYLDSTTIGSVSTAGDSSDLAGWTVLRYVTVPTGLSTDRNYITVDIQPMYSIFDTYQLHTVIGLSTGKSGSVGLSNSVYQSPSWDWRFDGDSYHIENTDYSFANSSYWAYLTLSNSNNTYSFVRADFTSQSRTSGYSTRAIFCGNNFFHSYGDKMWLFIAVPYVSSDSTGSNGTYTTTAGSGGGSTEINVSVDVDMSETNGILGTISDILSGIVGGIQGLFVPDTSWMNAWYESVEDTLDDVFGASSAASAMVEQAFTTLIQGTAVNSIYFPTIEIPNLSGGVVTLYAGGNVPLLPQNTNFTVASGFLGSASLYDYMKYLIDIVATMAVINMVRTKLHAILVGEVVATNDGGDDE